MCTYETWVEFMMHGVTCTCPYSPCLHAGNWWRSRAAVRTRALQCLHFPSWRATRYCTWLGMQASLFDQAILYYMPCLWPHCFTNERPRLMAPAQLGRVVRHDAHPVVHRHNHPNSNTPSTMRFNCATRSVTSAQYGRAMMASEDGGASWPNRRANMSNWHGQAKVPRQQRAHRRHITSGTAQYAATHVANKCLATGRRGCEH